MTRPTAEDRPDSIIGGLLWDHNRRVLAAGNHAVIEGHNVGTRTVLQSYDRTLHPIMHGRRPADLVEKVREVLGR